MEPKAKKVLMQVPSLDRSLGKDNVAKIRKEEEE
jgi:hypothetical protein